MPTKTKEPIRFFGLELSWLPSKGTVPDINNPLVNPLAVCLGLSLGPIPTLYILHAACINAFDPEIEQVLFPLSAGASMMGLGEDTAQGKQTGPGTAEDDSSASSDESGEEGEKSINEDSAVNEEKAGTSQGIGVLENLVFHLPLASLSQRAHEILLTLLANGELTLVHPTTGNSFPSDLYKMFGPNSNVNTTRLTAISIAPHDVIRDLTALINYTTSATSANLPILSLRVPYPVSVLAKRCGGCGRWEGMKRKTLVGEGECGYEYRRWRECKCGREWYCREKCRWRVFSTLDNELSMNIGDARHELGCEEWRTWKERKTLGAESMAIGCGEEAEFLKSKDFEDDVVEDILEVDEVLEHMRITQDAAVNTLIAGADSSLSDLPGIIDENAPTPESSDLSNPHADPEPRRPDSATVPEIIPIHSPQHLHYPNYNHHTAELTATALHQDYIERRFRESYERAQMEMAAVGFMLMPLPEARLTSEVVEAVIEMANVQHITTGPGEMSRDGVRKGNIVVVDGAGGVKRSEEVGIRHQVELVKEGIGKMEGKMVRKCEELVEAMRELVSLAKK